MSPVVLTLAKLLAPDSSGWPLVVSFVPFALPGYLVAALLLVLLWRGSSRALVVCLVVGLLGLAAHVAWLVPSYAGSHAHGKPDLTVLGLNMHFGRADATSAARLVKRVNPDVIVLTEATPEAVARLAQQGDPIEAPAPFWLTAVHTTQPLYSNSLWRHDFGSLVAGAAEVKGPQVLIGDFNATLDHGQMRDLLGTGLHDAAREANSGWQPTWPSPGSRTVAGIPVPLRVMALDHVLLSTDFSAVSTSVYPVPGTDHEALVARLVLR